MYDSPRLMASTFARVRSIPVTVARLGKGDGQRQRQ